MMPSMPARALMVAGKINQLKTNFLRGKSQEMTSILYLNLFQCFPDSKGSILPDILCLLPPPDSSKIPGDMPSHPQQPFPRCANELLSCAQVTFRKALNQCLDLSVMFHDLRLSAKALSSSMACLRRRTQLHQY